MRLWSFRRFDGFHWAKAIRDIRSPPNVAWGFRLDTEAITSPEASSSSVVTTLVVPTSIATPNAIAVVSPRSTPRGAPWNVTTVTSPLASRSAAGSVRTTSSGTSSGARPAASASCSRSEVWWCSSCGSSTRTSFLRIPASMATCAWATAPGSTPRIWNARSSRGGAIWTTSGSVGASWQERRYPSRTRSLPS